MTINFPNVAEEFVKEAHKRAAETKLIEKEALKKQKEQVEKLKDDLGDEETVLQKILEPKFPESMNLNGMISNTGQEDFGLESSSESNTHSKSISNSKSTRQRRYSKGKKKREKQMEKEKRLFSEKPSEEVRLSSIPPSEDQMMEIDLKIMISEDPSSVNDNNTLGVGKALKSPSKSAKQVIPIIKHPSDGSGKRADKVEEEKGQVFNETITEEDKSFSSDTISVEDQI